MHPQEPRPGEGFFRALLEASTDVVTVVLSGDGTVRYATPSAAALFGPGPVTGMLLADLVDGESRPAVAAAVGQLLARAGPADGAAWPVTGRHGRRSRVEVRSSDLRGAGPVGGIVLSLRDVTSERAREDELRHAASHDPLTGLANRALFWQRAEDAVSAVAGSSGAAAALLLIDLDDFKLVNDTWGHGAGDELLVAAAGRIAGAARGTATAARYGGDEFALFLPDLAAPNESGAVADRVVRAFSVPFRLSAAAVTVTVSVGVATTRHAGEPRVLLEHADLALYAAKRAGKGRWRAHDPEMITAAAGGEDGQQPGPVSGLAFPGQVSPGACPRSGARARTGGGPGAGQAAPARPGR